MNILIIGLRKKDIDRLKNKFKNNIESAKFYVSDSLNFD